MHNLDHQKTSSTSIATVQPGRNSIHRSAHKPNSATRSHSTAKAKPPFPSRRSPSTQLPQLTLNQFAATIRQEFIQGSAIDPDLYAANVEIVSDTVTLPGHEVSYPIHEALNWSIARFGHQARSTLYAALLQNEDSSCWQAKLSTLIVDSKKGKARKYETPAGNGTKAYLPVIPTSIRQAIALRYNVDVPLTGSFWDWLTQNPQIPIIYTEGGKKALSLLSLGYVAIALYGVNGGYRAKDAIGNPCPPYLVADVDRFTTPNRPAFLAFDQDAKAETNAMVNIALARFGSVLQRQGAIVSIVTWDGRQGKGVDDLIVNAGANAFHTAFDAALAIEHWQIQNRLLKQLTYTPARVINTADLTTLDWSTLPDKGIIAIYSAKGTAKTLTIGQLIQLEPTVALATHRIGLGRNLCRRIKIDWRGDLDKAQGQFITGSGYTLRVGFCVDSLLAIDPNQFKGCVLILDEVVQVLRHLLTSSTCKKGGKLPALLARLRELMQVARRIIVADADLNDATLHYLADLRGDNQPIHLIRNDYQSAGYLVQFIQSSNASPAIAQLLRSVEAGHKVFVTTDSKAGSKRLALQLRRLGANVLLINSETSGGEQEQRFINNPDESLCLDPVDVVIVTPSFNTGGSIESSYFDQVFGLFYGVSSTDADMSQGLGRVRPPVPRTVWCAKQGLNFSSLSRSTHAEELRKQLKQRTDWTAAVLRANLREDVREALDSYDWQTDPHLRLWSRIVADTNFSMLHPRSALLARLKFEGHQVTVVDLETDPLMQAAIRQAKAEIEQIEAQAIVRAKVLTPAELALLENGEISSFEDLLNVQKTHFAEFYCLEKRDITLDAVLADRNGQRRTSLLALEAQLYPDIAQERDLKGLERQVNWGKGLCTWDIGTVALRRLARQQLGLQDFLSPDKEWTLYDLKPIADAARRCRTQIKLVLNFTISDAVSDTQIVHQLLAQLGVKLEFRWSRSVPGHQGEKLKVYRLCQQTWTAAMEILDRRAARRRPGNESALAGSPTPITSTDKTGGDPLPTSISTNPAAAGQPNSVIADNPTSAIELEALSLDEMEESWSFEADDLELDD